MPPPAIRELRDVCRGRHQVIRVRTRLAQMIRSLLLRIGVPDVPVRRVFSARGLAWLETVTLPPDAAASGTPPSFTRRFAAHGSLILNPYVVGAIQTEAAQADAAITARAAADPIATALDTIVGIGPVLALTIPATSSGSRVGRRSPATRVWCRASTRVRAGIGVAASRAKDRRGSAGPSSKRRCMRCDGRMRSAAGRGSSRSGQAPSKRASRWPAACVMTSCSNGRSIRWERACDVLSTHGAPVYRMTS